MTEQDTTNRTDAAVEGKLLDGRFMVKRRLGAGNFGAVYLAEQYIFGTSLRPVALKLFHGQMVNYNNAAEVLKDAIMLIQLQQEPSHKEIADYMISVVDAGFLQSGQAFVAMEYVEGYTVPNGGSIHTLDGMIKAFSPVPIDLAVRWMLQVLKPLAWMHTLPRPVLHCDLKPDNVLASGKDMLKLADFGLAQLVYGILGVDGPCGALCYQSPEMLAGLNPTAASDVYSLGLMFYELLTGHNPLSDLGKAELLEKKHTEYRNLQIQARLIGLPSLAELDHPELRDHPLLIQMVERCLRPNASDRYDNAAALMRDLQAYMAGGAVSVIPTAENKSDCDKEISPEARLERILSDAQALAAQNRTDEAQDKCRQAMQLDPRSAKPYVRLAMILLEEGAAQEALALCAQGRTCDPLEPELLDVMANSYDVLGRLTIAQEMRKAALALRRRLRP